MIGKARIGRPATYLSGAALLFGTVMSLQVLPACNEIIGADEPLSPPGTPCVNDDQCAYGAPCVDFVCACKPNGAVCGENCARECGDGEGCETDHDCTSDSICHSAPVDDVAKCMPEACAAHGFCGGNCGPCANGGFCMTENDCISGFCDIAHTVCVGPSCIVDEATSYCGPGCRPSCRFEECESLCVTGQCDATAAFPCSGPGTSCACD